MATDVATGLPQVDLLHGSVLTVTLDVAGAKITVMNVHGFESGTTTAGEPAPLIDPSYLPGAEAA